MRPSLCLVLEVISEGADLRYNECSVLVLGNSFLNNQMHQSENKYKTKLMQTAISYNTSMSDEIQTENNSFLGTKKPP